MSKSIVLICPKSIVTDKISFILLEAKISDWRIIVKPNECYIDTENTLKYVSISIDNNLDHIAIDDYMEWENTTKEFTEELIESNFFHIAYNDIKFCKDILKEILSSYKDLLKNIWMDNDYGVILNTADVLKCIRDNDDWDWRRYNFPEIPSLPIIE